jgi:hypothetical protein
MAIMIADRYRLTVISSIVRVIVTESGGGVNGTRFQNVLVS